MKTLVLTKFLLVIRMVWKWDLGIAQICEIKKKLFNLFACRFLLGGSSSVANASLNNTVGDMALERILSNVRSV